MVRVGVAQRCSRPAIRSLKKAGMAHCTFLTVLNGNLSSLGLYPRVAHPMINVDVPVPADVSAHVPRMFRKRFPGSEIDTGGERQVSHPRAKQASFSHS